jgi:glycosyltransferase involved in cell wall biosynthesis
MLPLISIIIPCYNSGAFLPDALESVARYPQKSIYEVIIVNDGSTDPATLTLLERLQGEGYTVVHQENKGCGGARNAGINISKGEYLLFLDCDNKIYPAYIDKGIQILKAQPEAGVVYGNPHFFGDSQKPRFWPADYDLLKMVSGNYIDVCAVVRKKVWEELGGFEETRLLNGHEDWDFWIRAGEAGWQFVYLNETLYEYRIRKDSLVIDHQQEDKMKKVHHYLYNKHFDLFMRSYTDLNTKYQFYQYDQQKPLRSFFKFVANKISNKTI